MVGSSFPEADCSFFWGGRGLLGGSEIDSYCSAWVQTSNNVPCFCVRMICLAPKLPRSDSPLMLFDASSHTPLAIFGCAAVGHFPQRFAEEHFLLFHALLNPTLHEMPEELEEPLSALGLLILFNCFFCVVFFIISFFAR